MCVHVMVHVFLHEVCQQVSGGTGLSANSRSTQKRQDAHRHTCSHNSANPPTVDSLKGATL